MQMLFPKEEEIMYAIWNVGHPCVISEILKNDPAQKRNTVAKVLLILEKKEYIKVDSIVKTATRCGRAYISTISKEAYENQKKLFSIVEKNPTAQKGILSFVSSLVNSDDTDEQFINEMDKLIEEHKKNVRK